MSTVLIDNENYYALISTVTGHKADGYRITTTFKKDGGIYKDVILQEKEVLNYASKLLEELVNYSLSD